MEKISLLQRRKVRQELIAATAMVHGMVVVTRNITDFEPMGVKSKKCKLLFLIIFYPTPSSNFGEKMGILHF
jgi:hypothetical protein